MVKQGEVPARREQSLGMPKYGLAAVSVTVLYGSDREFFLDREVLFLLNNKARAMEPALDTAWT